MIVARYDDSFYETACEWWEAQGWSPMPKEALPQIGIISFDDETPVAVCWLYQTDSTMAVMEWMVANPEVRDKTVRKRGIESVMLALQDVAKSMGFKTIFTSTKNRPYMKKLENVGFQATEDNMTNFLAWV